MTVAKSRSTAFGVISLALLCIIGLLYAAYSVSSYRDVRSRQFGEFILQAAGTGADHRVWLERVSANTKHINHTAIGGHDENILSIASVDEHTLVIMSRTLQGSAYYIVSTDGVIARELTLDAVIHRLGAIDGHRALDWKPAATFIKGHD